MNKIDKQNKEILVRKRMSAFLEKALRYRGYDFRHDDYKHIVYGESACKTDFEYTIKSMYDAYYFLLSNFQNPLSIDCLKKFFYILEGKEADENLIIRMTTKLFNMYDLPALEKAIEYHLYVYNELCQMNDDNRLIVPLMFFNYVLAKSGVPILRFISTALKEYEECRTQYFEGNKVPIYQLFLEQLQTAKFQDKSFYKNLKPLTTKEVCNRILQDKAMLQERFGIKKIAIFGSFAKEMQRIDSDIDLIVTFSQDLSYEKKSQMAEKFGIYYLSVFNRYIDITEIGEYVSNWIIKEIQNYKIIF